MSTQTTPGKTNTVENDSKPDEAGKSSSKTRLHQRENLSDREILRKLEAHKASKEGPVTKVELSGKAPQVVEIGEVVKEPYGGLNDPNDPATVGKLQDMLKNGGVNFSGREKEVLGQILKDRV